MTTLLLTIVLISLLMLAMAVGVMVSNKELKGSCGGINNCACDEAGIPRQCELVPGPGQRKTHLEKTVECNSPSRLHA